MELSGIHVLIALVIPTFLVWPKRKKEKQIFENLIDTPENQTSHLGICRNQIVVERKKQIAGSAVAHTVFLDGKLIGKISSGKKIIIDTHPGNHNILVKGIWKQAASINFTILSNQKTTYVFDQLDLWKSDIKLSLVKCEFDGAEEAPIIIQKEEIHASRDLINYDTIIPETDLVEMCDVTAQPPNPSTPTKPLDKTPVRVKDRDPMEIIKLMERRFEEQYQFAYKHLFNLHDCQKIYTQTVNEFESIELPLMAQVRFEQLCAEYKEKFNITNPFVVIDAMDGYSFEAWCAELLRKSGFTNVEITPGSGDQGVDVIAVKDGIRYAIQCKCYSSDLGNTPVQEVRSGKDFYDCDVAVVMTNRYFTKGAKQLAEKTMVRLWDRNKLKEMIELSANRDNLD